MLNRILEYRRWIEMYIADRGAKKVNEIALREGIEVAAHS